MMKSYEPHSILDQRLIPLLAKGFYLVSYDNLETASTWDSAGISEPGLRAGQLYQQSPYEKTCSMRRWAR